MGASSYRSLLLAFLDPNFGAVWSDFMTYCYDMFDNIKKIDNIWFWMNIEVHDLVIKWIDLDKIALTYLSAFLVIQ